MLWSWRTWFLSLYSVDAVIFLLSCEGIFCSDTAVESTFELHWDGCHVSSYRQLPCYQTYNVSKISQWRLQYVKGDDTSSPRRSFLSPSALFILSSHSLSTLFIHCTENISLFSPPLTLIFFCHIGLKLQGTYSVSTCVCVWVCRCVCG